MCVSCGEKKIKRELTRLVLNERSEAVCGDRRGDGRGAYVCSRKSCWEDLAKGKKLNRAFRQAGPIAVGDDLISRKINRSVPFNRGGTGDLLQAQPTE
jgi:predicted RNA-binding protein YlxR (DUF448 family)